MVVPSLALTWIDPCGVEIPAGHIPPSCCAICARSKPGRANLDGHDTKRHLSPHLCVHSPQPLEISNVLRSLTPSQARPTWSSGISGRSFIYTFQSHHHPCDTLLKLTFIASTGGESKIASNLDRLKFTTTWVSGCTPTCREILPDR